MTLEELKQLVASLNLEPDPQPSLIYIFYATPDGVVNNLTVSLKQARLGNGRKMGDSDLAELMGQYPDARQGTVVAVERPHGDLHRWLDRDEVIRMLHTSKSTLARWVRLGCLHPSHLGRKTYFDADEVDRFLRSHMIQENGRLDKTGLLPSPSVPQRTL